MEQKSIFNVVADGYDVMFEGKFKFCSFKRFDFVGNDGNKVQLDKIKISNGTDSYEFNAPYNSGAENIKEGSIVLVKFYYTESYNKGFKNQKVGICGIFTEVK